MKLNKLNIDFPELNRDFKIHDNSKILSIQENNSFVINKDENEQKVLNQSGVNIKDQNY